MGLRWRKGENPEFDAKVEAGLARTNVRAGTKRRANANGRRTPAKAPWSSAKPTVAGDGIRYASKMEARVADRLRAALSPGERIVRQASFPLLVLEPGSDGKVARFAPDFIVVRTTEPENLDGWTALGGETWRKDRSESECWDGKKRRMLRSDERLVWVRVVEAKGDRRSRDYALRRDAFQAVYGKIWEWDGIGDLLPWESA